MKGCCSNFSKLALAQVAALRNQDSFNWVWCNSVVANLTADHEMSLLDADILFLGRVRINRELPALL